MKTLNYKGRVVEVELVKFNTIFNGEIKRFKYFMKTGSASRMVDKHLLKSLQQPMAINLAK